MWIFFILLASFLFSDRVVGYYPSWVQGDFNVDQIDFSTFTHVNHSFAWPNNQGDIQSDNGTFNTTFANHIQSQGSKFLLALGGWGAAESFAASTSTQELRSYFISNIIEKINRNLGVNIQDYIVEERVFTPKDISMNTNSYLGSLYGESSNGIFSPLKRHQNFSRSIKNLYFCGGTVHPGGGIPLCIMSSKIVSDLIEKSN